MGSTTTLKQFMHPKRYIDNVFRQGKPCAYCHSARHRGYLSPNLIRRHKCIEKHCSCLQKYDHPYWDKKSYLQVLGENRSVKKK